MRALHTVLTLRALPPLCALLLLGLGCDNGKGGSGGDGGEGDGGGDDTGAPAEYRPQMHCPGDPGCETATGALRVGAASIPITPTCFEGWTDLDADAELDEDEAFLDCGCDRLCPGDAGYEAPDEGEGDGEFQAVWMAGFQNNRPASGVHDDLWTRAIVFDQGDTRVALVMVDLVGWFNPDVVATRELVAARGLDVDWVIMASTHVHEGPDTMGLWGKTESRSGVDPDYLSFVHEQSADAIEAAIGKLTEVATMKVGEVDVSTYPHGAYNVVSDHRDPNVIDYRLRTAWFADASGQTLATLVHFGNHPENMADENSLLTSDFPDQLRTGVEEGVSWETYNRAGLGGTAIFVNGAVGGMMTPLGITVQDPDGNAFSDYTFERNDALGKIMAEMALDAVEGGAAVSAPSLSVTAHRFFLPVDNWGFQAMFLSGIIARETHNYDETKAIDETNIPEIETEIDLLRVGDLELLTIPGELFPELAIGGYDGCCTGSADTPINDADNQAPPDISQAPAGPYLDDKLEGPQSWIVGLGNDELGYILPPYDFVLDDVNPWFDEPELGDHYEETNSLGPRTSPRIEEEVDRLLGWVYAR